jgi:hypothetical protein
MQTLEHSSGSVGSHKAQTFAFHFLAALSRTLSSILCHFQLNNFRVLVSAIFLGHFEFRYQRADDVGSAVRCITGEQGIIHSDVAFYDLSAAISLGSRRE